MLWLHLSGFLNWAACPQGATYLALFLALAEVAGMNGRLLALLGALVCLNVLLH